MREQRRVQLSQVSGAHSNRLNRVHRSKKHSSVRFTAMFLAVVISVSAGFILSGKAASAGNLSEGATTFKYYKEVRISSGDTLWDLAEFYRSTSPEELELTTESCMKEIRDLNQLSDNHLRAGEYVMVPYYSSELK